MNPTAKGDGSPLLEREHELDVVGAALDRLAEGQGSALLIEGPAGIGKTRLLAAATELSWPRTDRVLAGRAGTLERGMPFAVARQLLEPTIEEADEEETSLLLSGSAALALTAFGRSDPSAPKPSAEIDQFAPIHGLYWLLANLGDSGPVVVVVDDAHWADTQSLRWLDFVARRVADTPALILIGARTGEPDEPDELEPLRLDATEILRPAPLSAAAIDELIGAGLGSSPSVEFSDACSKVTGGNPFLLTEVLRTFGTGMRDPGADAANALASLGTEPVARSVHSRLQPFGPEASSLARAIAVLGGAPQLRHAAEMAGIGESRAGDLCDQLRDAEILAPGHPIDFVHPLVRTAVYLEMPEEDRFDAHRRAAELMSSTGSGPRDVAPHLMACAPNGDRWVADQLRDAAGEAMGQGAPDAARRYLERALRELAGSETELTYDLGMALWGSSSLEAPAAFLSVAERSDDPGLELRALVGAAWTYFECGNLEATVECLRQAAETTPAEGVDDRLRAEAGIFCVGTIDHGRRPEDSARIAAVATDAGSTTLGELMAGHALAFDHFLECHPVDEVVALASRPVADAWIGYGPVPGFAARVVTWSGRWESARKLMEDGFENLQSTGLVHSASYREGFFAEIDRHAGRLADSEAAARTAFDIVRDLAPASMGALMAINNLLSVLVARGDLDEADEWAGNLEMSVPFSSLPLLPALLEIRGTLRLARGELEAGTGDLLAHGEDLEEMRFFNPAASPWRQEVAPALATLGRTGEAREIVAEGERRARRFGAGHVIGAMLRARSSVEGKARAFRTLRESVSTLEASGPPHELARSCLELGATLRRDGQRSESRGAPPEGA